MVYNSAVKRVFRKKEFSPLVGIFALFLALYIVCFKGNTLLAKLSFIVCCLAISCLSSHCFKPVASFCKILIPLLLPLIFIHSFLNSTYPNDNYLFGLLAYKSKGFSFSLDIASNLLVVTAVFFIFLSLNKDSILDWLIANRFPLLFCIVFCQSIAVTNLMQRKFQAIIDAQQARGISIPMSSINIIKRIFVLPSIILPAIATVLNETNFRITTLVSRGFASTRMSSSKRSLIEKDDVIGFLFLVIPLSFSLI